MRYKLIRPNGIAPERAHFDDAGIDLKTPFPFSLAPGESREVDTRVAFEIPLGHCGIVFNKSGLNIRFKVVTETGVIDSSYRGPVKVRITNQSDDYYNFARGDKISQMVVVPCLCEPLEEAAELNDGYSGRGTDGFGSTGR